MKIAIYHTTLPEPDRKPGGVEVSVHRLANELAVSNDVTVFSLTSCPADARYRHVRLFPRHPWLCRNRAARLFLLPFLLNGLSFTEYDVLHLHGDDWFYFRRQVPTVRTMHGSALGEARSATSWKRRLIQYCIYPLEHLAARLATVTMAVGPATANLYGVNHVTAPVPDLRHCHPGEKTAQPTVLFVGTWEGRKRGSFLFDVFTREVVRRVPDAVLYMVSDYCRAAQNVEYVRFPSDEELAALYRKAWVFAYPSTYEGFGLSYVEAMASGTAVLCTPNDGARYVLDESKYGVLASDNEFADQLISLLTHPEKRVELERKGPLRARLFAPESIAAQHRELYREAIALRHQKRVAIKHQVLSSHE